MPFIQLHQVEIELSAYVLYEIPSFTKHSDQSSTTQNAKFCDKVANVLADPSDKIRVESIACLNSLLIRQILVRFRSPIRLTKWAGTRRLVCFGPLLVVAKLFLASMPITSNNRGLTLSL